MIYFATIFIFRIYNISVATTLVFYLNFSRENFFIKFVLAQKVLVKTPRVSVRLQLRAVKLPEDIFHLLPLFQQPWKSNL